MSHSEEKTALFLVLFRYFFVLLQSLDNQTTFIIQHQTMDLLSKIVARAQSNKQRIVLPEAEEERTLCAADRALADNIADIVLIGNPEKVAALAKEKGLTNIDKATLIDPENYEKSEELAEKLAEIRKSKGMTIEEARKLIKNPLYLGCMIIKTEGADGQISGALSTTGDTLRPALQIIKCQPGITCVSGGPDMFQIVMFYIVLSIIKPVPRFLCFLLFYSSAPVINLPASAWPSAIPPSLVGTCECIRTLFPSDANLSLTRLKRSLF